MYRCEAVSVEGFIQQLAVSYLRHGYWFYVTGWVPIGKAPAAVDAKLIQTYGIGITKWARAWRRAQGKASMQYLRCDRFFVLLATHGDHEFFEREVGQIRDARRAPVKFAGYSISYRGTHPHVRIEQGEYLRRKAYLCDLARHWSGDIVAGELAKLPFEPYAPVRGQLLSLWRSVNRVRVERGFEIVPKRVLRLERRIVRPFGLLPEAVHGREDDGFPLRCEEDNRALTPQPIQPHLPTSPIGHDSSE